MFCQIAILLLNINNLKGNAHDMNIHAIQLYLHRDRTHSLFPVKT